MKNKSDGKTVKMYAYPGLVEKALLCEMTATTIQSDFKAACIYSLDVDEFSPFVATDRLLILKIFPLKQKMQPHVSHELLYWPRML